MNYKITNILELMLENAIDAINFADEINNVVAFTNNHLYRKAIIMSILNIGELTKQLPQEYKSTHNVIPWKQITGIRDIAAHGYHEMDDDIIWDVVTYSIPELKKFLETQINNF